MAGDKGVKYFRKGERVMAVLARPELMLEKLNFLTPEEFALQLGVHNREAGSEIKPHQHIPFPKLENLDVQEIFYVLGGEMEVSLYDEEDKLFEKVPVRAEELILINCGHGVSFTHDCRFFEIKQGPYRGNEGEKKQIGGG